MVDDRLRVLHAAVEEEEEAGGVRGEWEECTGEHGHLGIWNVVVVCPVLPGTAFDMPAVCLTHIGICLPVAQAKQTATKCNQRRGRKSRGKVEGSVGGFAIAVTICVQLRKNKSKKARERTCNEWRAWRWHRRAAAKGD